MPLVDGKWRRDMKQVTLAFCWPEAQGRKGVCVCPEGVHHSPGFLTTLEKQPGLLEGMEVLGRIVHLKSQGLLSLYIFLSLAPIYEGHAQ